MKQILVLKHGALGDIIQGIDAFESLRQSFPDAHITLLTSPAFAPLLEPSSWFDELVVDHRAPIWHIGSSLRLIMLLKRPFDAIIDLQCSSRTTTYFKLAKPKGRWFGTAKSCSDPMPDFTGVNNRDRMMAAVKMAGASTHTGNLNFMSADIQSQRIKLPEKYAVFVAGSSKAKLSKRWPVALFSNIAARCLSAGITPVLCGTEEDRDANNSIKKACSDVIDFTEKTSLNMLASIMMGAEFILGNDTGPVFLGARTNAPTCMLMGADTDPSMSAPIGENAVYLYIPDLTQLTADKVWEKLNEIRG